MEMDHIALHEVTKYFININKNEEGSSVWHNSTLAVRSEKGLHFYDLAHNVKCLDKKINCIQSFLPPVKSKASSKLFTDTVINNSMRNIDYVELIQDQAMWPHNPVLVHEMTCVVGMEWSPLGLLPNQESVLAVQNNIGGVNLYTKNSSKWNHLIELTAAFSESYRKTLKDQLDFNGLKEAAHVLATTAMCWGASLAGDGCCYIATAQKNGSIMFWMVSYDTNINVSFQGSIAGGDGEILAMRWIPVSINHFTLACTNIFGQIVMFANEIHNGVVKMKHSFTVWPDRDRMISKLLQVITINNKIILICNKHRHLLILMIDQLYNVCAQYAHNINDHRITSITNSKDEIFVTTVNGKIFKVIIAIDGDNLCVNLLPIECKDISPTSELYNISFSQNGVLCTLITVDRKVNYRKESLKINVILATYHVKLDSLVDILLENPSKKLTKYWDVIELLRYKSMKLKQAPPMAYNELYMAACNNHYLLKLYLIFITFYNNLRNLFKIEPMDDVPENSLDNVNEEILVISAEMLFRKFNNKRLNETLVGIEQETFLGALNFLEYYCKKNDRDLCEVLSLDKSVSFNKSDLGGMQIEYVCQGCEEKIQGFTCKNNHLNMFCSLTFTPIENFNYLSCHWCNRIARIELFIDNPMCSFCDVPLVVT